MFDWLLGKSQTQSQQGINQHSRNIYVYSSRRPTKIFTLYADTEICVTQAMKHVERQLPEPEPGEMVKITAYLTPNGLPE
ncbi:MULTISPECIES: hypothetical protein [unclassified Microcoleus]|uniref:hypothetical protein n=1 Tax=unclassified Microcoleus TaxID=2642155 RepID=UPI002FD31A3A